MATTKQKLSQLLLMTVGQNQICDSLPAINKAFDILEKETIKKVVETLTVPLHECFECKTKFKKIDKHIYKPDCDHFPKDFRQSVG